MAESLQKESKKQKKLILYKGIEYDSSYEVLMVQWLEEAKLYGYVDEWRYQPYTMVIMPPSRRNYQVPGKKVAVLDKDESLFGPIKYTPDFVILWTQKAIDTGLVMMLEDMSKKVTDYVFVAQLTKNGSFRTIIDIKPPTKKAGSNASYRDTGIKLPLIWALKGYYVQIIVPVNAKKPEDCMFSKTWAPRDYINRPRKDGKGLLMSYCLDKKIEDYERYNNG